MNDDSRSRTKLESTSERSDKSPMTLEEFIRKWEALPKLSPEEAVEYARNIEQARAELSPLRDPWA